MIYITSCVITLHRRLEKTERKCVGKRREKEEKARNEKGKGKGWNRPDRQGHGGTHSRMEEKEKL